MAAAPDADLRAYIAPNDPNFAPAIFDQMRQDGVDIISDSWGACEPLITPGLLAAENTSLELAAVAGISTFVATGDFGATDCFPFTGSTDLFSTTRPHSRSQPRSAGRRSRCRRCTERIARRPGAGPAAASRCTGRSPPTSSARRSRSRGRKCRSGTAQCRETPDVSLDARPKRSGYIIYCRPLRGRARRRLGADRRHERGGAAHVGPDRRRRRVGGQAARLRQPVPLRAGRDERLPRHRLGHEQPVRRQPLYGPPGLRPGDRARLDQGGHVRNGTGRVRSGGGVRRLHRPRRRRAARRPADRLRAQGHLPRDAHRHDDVAARRQRGGAGRHQPGHVPRPHERRRRVAGDALEGDPAQPQLARRLPRLRHGGARRDADPQDLRDAAPRPDRTAAVPERSLRGEVRAWRSRSSAAPSRS